MATLQTGPLNTEEYVRSVPQGQPLPPGIYSGVITKTQQKPTNDQQGMFVEVEMDITAPEEYSSRKFWDRFNVLNQSQKAAQIGREGLSDLAKAAGIQLLTDDEQLLGLEVLMELYVEPAKPYTDRNGVQQPGSPQNKCRKYWPVGTNIEEAKKAQKAQHKAAPAEAAQQPQNGQAPAAANRPNWNNVQSAPQTAPAAQAAAPVAKQPPVQVATAAPSAAAPDLVQQQQAAAPQVAAQAPVSNGVPPWKRNNA